MFRIEGYETGYAGSRDWLADRVRDRPQRYASAGTYAFSSIALEVVDMTVVGGAEIGRQLAPLAPLVEDAIAKLAVRAPDEAIAATELGTLDVFGTLAASGVAMADRRDAVKTILRAIPTSRDDQRTSKHWRRGFAALAVDAPEVWRGIAGFELRDPIPFTPGMTFGPNVQGCLAHFAGAIEHGAAVEACMPAWAELVAYSSPLAEAGSFVPAIFLWGAWVLQHRIARQPIATVADWMHESLYQLAGATP